MKAKSFIQKREGTKEILGGGEKICMKFNFFYMCELRQQIMKYFDFSLVNADLDHMVRFLIFRWGSVRCRLPTDFGLLFLGLENNGTIVVMFSFAW